MATTKKELEVSLSITPSGQPARTASHYRATVAEVQKLLADTLNAEGWVGPGVPAHSQSIIQRALAGAHYYSLDTVHTPNAASARSRVVALVKWVEADAARRDPGVNQVEGFAQGPEARRRHEYLFNDPRRKRLSAYQERDGRFFLVNGHGSGLGAPWGLGAGGSADGYYAGIEELQAALDAHHAQGGWAQWAVQVSRTEWEVMTAGCRARWEAGSHGAAELKADMAVEAAHQALDELSLVADYVTGQCVHRALLKLLQVRFFSQEYAEVEVVAATEDVRRAVFYAYSDAWEGPVASTVRPMLERRLAEAKGLAVAADQARRSAVLAARSESLVGLDS